MSPQQVRDWYRSHGGKPVPALVQTALVLLVLHYVGLLLPLTRFFFLAVMLIAGAAALLKCAQIAIRSRGRVGAPEASSSSELAFAGASGVAAVLAGVLLLLIAAMDRPIDSSTTEGSTDMRPASASTADIVPTSNARTKSQSAEPVVQPADRWTGGTKRSADTREGFNSVLGELIQSGMQQQAAEQERRDQNLQRAIQNARMCPRCGGAGTYRYVDSAGVLQAQQCPACFGRGRAF